MDIGKVALIYDDRVRPDTTGIYCRRALGTLVEVEHFLPTELSRIPRRGFDLYLNIDDGLEYRLPADLRPCAWWAIDTHLNYDWCRRRARDFDLVFAAQRDGAERFRSDGISSACWLPLACDPEMHRKHDLAKQYDVCFVGHLFPGPRSDLVALIQRHFANVFVGRKFFDEMARIYSVSRIVFNRSLKNDVNMRVFEALACGSLLLTNDLTENGQEELFQNGLHLATYRDAQDLLDKIEYYLAHEERRENIAACGRQEAVAKQTYCHRMAQVLQRLEELRAQTNEAARPIPISLPHDLASVEVSPPDWTRLLSPGANRILEIVDCKDSLGPEVKEREDLGPAEKDLQRIEASEVEAHDAGIAAASVDAILCSALGHFRDPTKFLRRARHWLKSGGYVIAAVSNVRHHRVVRTLLEGSWPWPNGQGRNGGPKHCFTRRETEKLFFRAGFSVEDIQLIPDPSDHSFQENVQGGRVTVGRLHVGGLPSPEAEEFYASYYLVKAVPSATPDWGLTSIIILTHDQLTYTKKCLDSILQYNDESCEVIVVDNGSTDGTPEYVQSLINSGRSREGEWGDCVVRIIRNSQNLGFPKAANQGIQASTGRQILLLNNDCIVTTGWLGRLLRALHSHPQIGLVGPCSNFVSGSQQVPVHYDDLLGLDGFAWDFSKANHGRLEDTDRLVGFCLLIRRELVEAIGLLDERFGVGGFEDDDYCRRALAAGFRAVIARDAFVHHFGGRTFVGMGINFATLSRRNQQLFTEKWQERERLAKDTGAPIGAPSRRAIGYSLRSAPRGGLLLCRKEIELSLCMIVRDNARTIEECLKSIKPWVDEMVVVDTGSKDNTPVIAKRLGARVFHFPWCDSFSAARNQSLNHARGQWLFWMDSDDEISESNGRRLRQLIRQADPQTLGFVVSVHCPGPGEDGQDDVTVVTHIKLFRNFPHLRFEGRIHEQILAAIRRAGGNVVSTDVYVTHGGYDHSPEGQERKKQRDLHLLHLELQEQPDHPFTLFNLGMTYADLRQYQEAVNFLNRSIDKSEPTESHLRKAYAILVYCHSQLGNGDKAWEVCQTGLRLFPQDIELRFREGILLHEAGRLTEAVQAYQRVLTAHEEPHFFSIDQGIKGFKTRQNLAVVYMDLGDLPHAEEQWQKVTEEKPNYRFAWRGLGEALLDQNLLERAEKLKNYLLKDPHLCLEGVLLQSQLAARRGDFDQARQILEKAVKKYSKELLPLQALCRILVEQDDPARAEKALRELVQRDPEDAAACHNLGVACMRQRKFGEALAALRESLRIRPRSVITLSYLAEALAEAGHIEKAIAAWGEVLRLAPGRPEATQVLQRAKDELYRLAATDKAASPSLD